MSSKKHWNLSAQILIGLLAGVAVGLCMQGEGARLIANNWIKPFGTLFLNAIKMLIVPLVFSSLIVGTCGLGDAKRVGRIGGKTIVFYLCTTALAVTIGLVVGNLGNVGGDFVLAEGLAYEAKEAPNVIDTLLNIVPSNPLKALVEGNMLQIIAFALFLGGSIIMTGERAKPVSAFFDGLAECMYTLVAFIMKFSPIAIFALITPIVAANGPAVLLPLLSVILAVYLGCILHMAIVYSFSVRVFAKVSPLTFFKQCSEAILFAFTTASSSATLPFSMVASERLGVSLPIRSFVLPLGATINMDGTAIYQGICALFIANVYGVSLSLGQQLTIILTTTLASIGTAGVPGAGVVMLGLVLQSVGLPIEGVALIAGIDRILDMARTTANITGDIACSVVVAASEKDLAPVPVGE
ncbi:MAG: dicarboxylate/amino acid:cation symporter [Candidatus Fimivivens sp.]